MTVIDKLSILSGMKHKDVISLWPSAPELAKDLGHATPYRVQKWVARNRIPPDHWRAVVTAASRRGFDLQVDDLVDGVSSSEAA